MKIYVCETKALAKQVADLYSSDKVIDLGEGPWEDVIVEERNGNSPNRIWDYSGLKRHVLVVKD